jgi:hypothetical protein
VLEGVSAYAIGRRRKIGTATPSAAVATARLLFVHHKTDGVTAGFGRRAQQESARFTLSQQCDGGFTVHARIEPRLVQVGLVCAQCDARECTQRPTLSQ